MKNEHFDYSNTKQTIVGCGKFDIQDIYAKYNDQSVDFKAFQSFCYEVIASCPKKPKQQQILQNIMAKKSKDALVMYISNVNLNGIGLGV